MKNRLTILRRDLPPNQKKKWFWWQLQRGLADLLDGATLVSLWTAMGSQEIRQRYRRSRLGVFWITLSMAVTVGALGLLYGALFKQPIDTFLPYLAAGFVVWGLISGLINDGTRVFIESEGLIKQLAAPLSTYVYCEVWKNVIIFGHNVLVYMFVMIFFLGFPGWSFFMVIPGVVVVILNGVWMGMLFGLTGARFRDVPQIAASITQVLFFVTPIIWMPDMLPERVLLLDVNPAFHLLEIVRAPMLGALPDVESWFIAGATTALGWLVAITLYTIYRWRIAYWV